MLPLLYTDSEIAAKIVENPQTAPIPPLHKAMYRWVELFTRRSWKMTAEDVQALRDAGASDRDIAQWAQIASMQTWWVMMADGGGISLDGDALQGAVVGNQREFYEKSAEGLLAAAPDGITNGKKRNQTLNNWIDTDRDSEIYLDAANRARDRYGVVPNLYAAVSLAPSLLPRHESALQLLEGPQSNSLGARRHALVRALVGHLNRSDYSAATAKAMVERNTGDPSLYDRVTGPWNADDWDEMDRAVLEFTIKATRNAYKITDKDAQSFRNVGLDGEAYVDVLNTVAIQTSLDRLANSLGIAPDERPLLALEAAASP